MIAVLSELFWVLRREGFVISVAQAEQSMRAAFLVGFSSPQTLCEALSIVIVDRKADKERFRRTFRGFFASGARVAESAWQRLIRAGFSESELSTLQELLRKGDGPAPRLSSTEHLLTSELWLESLLVEHRSARALTGMTSALQAGFYAKLLEQRFGLPHAAHLFRRIRGELAEQLGAKRADALMSALRGEISRFRQRIRSHVEDVAGGRGELDAARDLFDRPLASLVDSEIERVRVAIQTLGKRLVQVERLKKRREKRGRIDVHRTLRQSMRTGAVPFVVLRRRRRKTHARLYLLCDVSESVRAASGFLLAFVVAMGELFDSVRTFVFVSELAETTDSLRSSGVARALLSIEEGSTVPRGHNSNYGRAFSAFERLAGTEIDKRCRIVVLGDGRTNFLDAGLEPLARLKARAKSVTWICPENRAGWGMGDSAMREYQGIVDTIMVASTGRELETAARELCARRK